MVINPLSSSRRALLYLLLSELRESGIRPRKKLGQHFLVDPKGFRMFYNALKRLDAKPWTPALEIGTGPGLLACATRSLVPVLVSVDVDMRLLNVAKRVCKGANNVLLIYGDGITFARTWRGIIVSNTPYNLSSKLLATIARNNHVNYAVLGVQREIAEKVIASPGSKNYGRITVLARLFFEIEHYGILPRSWFYPAPEVDGSIIILRRIREWSMEYDGFERFTACLFSQRNKLARKVVAKCTNNSIKFKEEKRIRELTPLEVLEVYREWTGRGG
jgi:16S rRNA (adenine1518-N6/adenine1519-N6)-dimethyltransferase